MKYVMSYGLAAVLMAAAGASGGSGSSKPTPSAAETAMAAEIEDLKRKLAAADEQSKSAEAKASADLEKANSAAKVSALRAEVLAAVAKLKHANDADWMEDGRPSLKRVIQLVGNDTVTSEDIAAVAPDLRRETVASDAAKAKAAKAAKDDDTADEREYLDGVWVRALEVGQHGGKLREPGERFVYTGVKGKWVQVLKGKEASRADADRRRLAEEQDGDDD